MPMTFTTCISAQDFGLASETMIPGFQASQLSCAAPAQIVRVDPCHVFDESFLQDLVLWWTWPDTRIPLYIAGPTGCGKTTSVLQFLARVHVPVISLTCSRRFVKDDLVGRWGAHEGGFAWIDGPATIAWKTGAVLLINEFSLAPPEVWVGANDIFEGQSITIEKTGLSIPRHVNTRVIVTDNCRCGTLPESAYSSRNQQDASTCDRFWHMAADWPKPEVEARIVLYRCERIAQGALSSKTLSELARCAARFAQASRTNPALEANFVSEDVPAALSTRVVIRLCEILTQLLAGSCSPEQSLSRAVRLAIGSALNDRACLTLLEMAAFHFAPLLETLHSSTAANRKRRNVRPKIG